MTDADGIERLARTGPPYAARRAAKARSITSGVTSAIPSTVTAASASASGAGGNARIGTATTAMPAAAAERSPLLESSTATHRAGQQRQLGAIALEQPSHDV